MAEPLLRHEPCPRQPPFGYALMAGCMPRNVIVSAFSCRRSPDIASKNSPCPLPATPAMPTTSPGITSSQISCSATANGPEGACDRPLIDSSGFVSHLRQCRRACNGGDVIAHHHPRQRRGRFRARVACADHLAMPKHSCAVAQPPHLIKPVTDVEDRLALIAQPFQRHKQFVRFLRRQHRSRLVKNDQFRFLQQAAHDLDALPLANGKITNEGTRIKRQTVGLR